MILDSNSASGVFEIDNSLKLERDNDEQLERASSNGNRRTWTHSCWFKMTNAKSEYGYVLQHFGVNNQATRISVDPGENYRLQVDLCDTGTSLYRTRTNRMFRDPAAWYHVVVAVDTTQSTDSNRLKIYVNGVQETSFAQVQYPTQNLDTLANVSGYGNEAIATFPWAGSTYDGMFYGYVAEHILVDGQQLTPTSFGEFDDDSGIWKPIDPSTITFGTNGHYLKFDDSSSLGADSGNSNNYTTYNISAADQAIDVPTNNFCTAFTDQVYNSTDKIDHREGATKLITGSGTGWRTNMATVSLSSGKWYFEAKHPGTIDGDAIMTSIVPTARFGNSNYASFYGGQSSGDGLGFYWDSKRFRYDDGSTISPPQNTINSGDILGIALDMDNNYVYSRINGGSWHNNGSANGDPTSGSSGTGGFAVADEPHMICTSMYHPNKNFYVNFGGYNSFPVSSAESDANGYGTFEYAPPSGYYAICTKNLAEYG